MAATVHSPSPSTMRSRSDSLQYVEEEKPVLAVEGDMKIVKVIEFDSPNNSDGMCVKYSEGGSKIAVGLSNGTIKIFKADTLACIYHLADNETRAIRLPVTSINFVPQANSCGKGELLIATYASGLVKFWHISTEKALHTIHEPRQVLSSSLSIDKKKLVTVGSTDEIRVYALDTGKQIHVCEPSPNVLVMDGHRCRVFAVKHHPTETDLFISGGWDDTIQFWDHRLERSTKHIFGPHICGEGLDIDPKFNHILSASWRKQDALQVWDFNTGNLIKTIPPDYGNNSLLYSCQWLGKNHIICGGCDTNMLRVIDKTTLATSGQVVGLPGGVYSIDYDHSRKSLSQHGPAASDITGIAAVVSKSLYILSNAAPTVKS